jgi:hypothetical protein
LKAAGCNISRKRTLWSIDGPPARVFVRFKFSYPSTVSLGGRTLEHVTPPADGVSVEFMHQNRTALAWR